MADFKPKDRVIVSGIPDPVMTVESVDGDDVNCVWPVGKKLQKGTFKSSVLECAPPPVKPTVGIVHLGNNRQSITDRASRIFPKR
jgi:hypothetical protein